MLRRLGILGGSGTYDLPGLTDRATFTVETPWGPPSSPLVRGRLGQVELTFLARHGQGHPVPPHQVNYRANLCALKQAGVEAVVALSAVGSMREHIAPGEVVVVDQYLDFTKRRPSTFFEDGVAAHVAFADPVCPLLAAAVAAATERAGGRVHRGGTYLCMEGPQFSTRAESLLYRSWGIDVIGMTALPEAKLAREAELPYATVAFATDYDCWHHSEAPVTVEAVLAVMHANVELGRRLVAELCASPPELTGSPAHGALAGAVITAPGAIGAEARARLSWLLPLP